MIQLVGLLLGFWHFQTFAIVLETARPRKNLSRLSRPRWRRGDSGNGATQNAISRLSLPKWSRLDFHDQGGDGSNFVTEVDTAQLSKLGWKRRDFPYQGADGATFQTEAETALAKKNNFFYDRGGFGAISATRLKTMQLVSESGCSAAQ